jgi:hypothetical protein
MAEWQNMFGDSDSDSDSDSGGQEEASEQVESSSSMPAPFVIKQIPGIGGMRGVFAARDLPAGTLVLAEVPTYTWQGHFSDVDVLRQTVTGICTSAKAHAATQALHPFVIEDADEEEVAAMRELWEGALSLAVDDLKTKGADGAVFSANELLRVSIALQHNAYGSGFYEIFSLVNHTCSPNCMKLCPSMDKGWRKASEIWTTRDVSKGEELTICYNHVREMTDKSIAHFLHEHHRFKCACPIHPPNDKISNDMDEESSQSAGNETSLENDWSSVLQERVEYYEEQLGRFTGDTIGQKKKIEVMTDIVTACEEILSEITDKIKSSPELFANLTVILSGALSISDNELIKPSTCLNFEKPLPVMERDALYMMVRLHKLVVAAASVCIEEFGKKEAVFIQKQKSVQAASVGNNLVWASEQYILHALEVTPLQMYYLGDNHPDIAQTLLDIAEGISCALSLQRESAKHQVFNGMPSPTAVADRNVLRRVHIHDAMKFSWAQADKSAQQMMNVVRKEGERVASLYTPRYDLVQERLVSLSLEMPSAYVNDYV